MIGCRVLLCSSSDFPGTLHLFAHRVLQLQDEDYLILSNFIPSQTLRTYHGAGTTVRCVCTPPHERLSSHLGPSSDLDGNLPTSFAWLGHDTMMHRSPASEFLSLSQVLEVSKEETRMADNYFSVLRDYPLKTWFDQGSELGSGQAFTVGSEGHERN